MIYAYDKIYVNDAMNNLGEAVNYAVNGCGINPEEFMKLFIISGVADQFGKGVPKFVSGLSGTELVLEMISRSGFFQKNENLDYSDYTPEYWCGWILAYYQWATGRSFRNIMQYVSMKDIIDLFPMYCEASEEKFVNTLNHIIKRRSKVTKLHIIRKNMGYSQKALSQRSGVTLRMIQQYEQRAKDINKASVSNLLALSRVLGCDVEDLMEMGDLIK